MNRHVWVLVHRYTGLYMALFLLVAGLTGSIMAFDTEIEGCLNPPVKVVPRAGPRLDELILHDHALILVPQGQADRVDFFGSKPDEAYKILMVIPPDAATGKPEEYLQLSLNPYTGEEITRKKVVTEEDFWPITRENFVPFILALHYRLALPGSIGVWLFGIAALVWTFDCFVGAYLTFPLRVRRLDNGDKLAILPRKSWWSRWKPSWLIKWHASAFRVNFDLHRAGGLWVWLMLLVLAWSSVGYNLSEQAYIPVMKAVFSMPVDPLAALPTLTTPAPKPTLGWRRAYTIARQFMAEQAKIYGFKVQDEVQISYVPEKGVFMYAVNSDRDISDTGGGTYVLFNGTTGKFLGLSLPTGQNAGTTLHTWIFTLHTASIWGLPFKLFISFMGFLITMLSVTGVYIWLKKCRVSRLKRKVVISEAIVS